MFARFVRRGFDGSDAGLPDRIRGARRLAFCYLAGGTLAAVAALKSPRESYREEVFKKAAARGRASEFELELGWVFVLPAHRGNRIAESLCRRLLAGVPDSGVFATTRPDNTFMIKILRTLGFAQDGRPFPRREEELMLFLRSRLPSGAFPVTP